MLFIPTSKPKHVQHTDTEYTPYKDHPLVCFAGLKRSGKNTAADVLRDDFDFTNLAHADPLKKGVAVMFDLTEEEQADHLKEEELDWLPGTTLRRAYQSIGTEWGRNMIHENLWSILLVKKIQKLRTEAAERGTQARITVSDVRFEDEARVLREMGGVIVHIRRPQPKKTWWGRLQDWVHSWFVHASERGVSVQLGDFVVTNDRDLEQFRERIRSIGWVLGLEV